MEAFRDAPKEYKQLTPIMIDILTLSDYIHQNLAEKYKSIGGFSALIDDGKERKGITDGGDEDAATEADTVSSRPKRAVKWKVLP